MRLFLCTALALGALPASVRADEPVSPSGEVVKLFNGKDLTGLYTWLKDTKREDPRKVFSVEDGVIHVSGDGFGYLATDKEYRDYHLIVEYKWGKRTDGGKFVRNSGLLLHATGPDGGANGTWMSCIECQLAQGCVGDLIVIRGKDEQGKKIIPVQLTSDVVLGPDKTAALEEGRQAARLHQPPTVVVAARSRLQGTARHPRQERRRKPARRVDARRMRLRRQDDHRDRQRHTRSTRRTTCFPRPARSCCSAKGSSCTSASSSCSR